jgi:alpha-L-rhamnosidase
VGNNRTNLARIELPLFKKLPKRAMLYITAPGCVVLSMNGQPLGIENGVCPLATLNQGRRLIYAEAHDLLPYLSSGRNVLGLILGNGLFADIYKPKITRGRKKKNSPPPIIPNFRAKIVFVVGNEKVVIVSGDKKAGWVGTKRHILSEDPFAGTVIDWRLLPRNWDKPEYKPRGSNVDRTKWIDLPIVPGFADLPRGMHMPLSVTQKQVTPVSVQSVNEGGGTAFVFDLGENIVGTCEVRAQGPPGSTVTLRGGEMLLRNGSLSLNFPKRDVGVFAHFQRDHHILRGEGSVEALRPIFVWYGMQFVSVHISDGIIFNGSVDELTCHQFLPDIPETSSIEFSDDSLSRGSGAMLGKIQQMVLLTQKGNLADYAPTDCPTREKHFWLGDALVTAEEAMLNLQMAPLLANYIEMIAISQRKNGDLPPFVPGQMIGPAVDISWTSAFPLLVYGMYQNYGDVDIVEKHYSAMCKYMGNLRKLAKHYRLKVPIFYQYGDWCSNQSRKKATPATGPPLAAFHYILACDAMAIMARVVGADGNGTHWEMEAATSRLYWRNNHVWYDKRRGLYGYDAETGFAVQTMTAAPLAMGHVIPEKHEQGVLQRLASSIRQGDYHPTYGSIGAKHVLLELSRHGMHEVAMRMATQTTFPSYGYWIKQGRLLLLSAGANIFSFPRRFRAGATTCWESWSGKPDASHIFTQPTHNHIFLCGGVRYICRLQHCDLYPVCI